jgi:hypothetical protein
LASGRFVLGVKSLHPPAGVVLRCLEIEIFNVLVHLAAEATSLVVRRAPDGENSTPKRPVGFDPQEAFTEHDEICNVENSVGIQIVKLNPIGKEKTSKERMRGKQKPPKEKCKKDYSEARGWTGNNLWAGIKSLRWIIFQDADLLSTLQLLVMDLGLDPVPNSRRVGVHGFGRLCATPAVALAAVEPLLPMKAVLCWRSHRNGRKERFGAARGRR